MGWTDTVISAVVGLGGPAGWGARLGAGAGGVYADDGSFQSALAREAREEFIRIATNKEALYNAGIVAAIATGVLSTYHGVKSFASKAGENYAETYTGMASRSKSRD